MESFQEMLWCNQRWLLPLLVACFWTLFSMLCRNPFCLSSVSGKLFFVLNVTQWILPIQTWKIKDIFPCLQHVWCLGPFLRSYKINGAFIHACCTIGLTSYCAPVMETCGLLLGKIKVKYQRLPDGKEKEDMFYIVWMKSHCCYREVYFIILIRVSFTVNQYTISKFFWYDWFIIFSLM